MTKTFTVIVVDKPTKGCEYCPVSFRYEKSCNRKFKEAFGKGCDEVSVLFMPADANKETAEKRSEHKYEINRVIDLTAEAMGMDASVFRDMFRSRKYSQDEKIFIAIVGCILRRDGYQCKEIIRNSSISIGAVNRYSNELIGYLNVFKNAETAYNKVMEALKKEE